MTPSGCPVTPGFPIRRSPDQSLFDSSPRHIAAYHVLHRLSTPRHPPCTLSSLTTFMRGCHPEGFHLTKRPLHIQRSSRLPALDSSHKTSCHDPAETARKKHGPHQGIATNWNLRSLIHIPKPSYHRSNLDIAARPHSMASHPLLQLSKSIDTPPAPTQTPVRWRTGYATRRNHSVKCWYRVFCGRIPRRPPGPCQENVNHYKLVGYRCMAGENCRSQRWFSG